MWDPDDLSSAKTTQKITNMKCDVITSDKLNENFDDLKTSGSKHMGIIPGLMDVKGSANYQKKKKGDSRQSSVRVKVKFDTMSKSLTMNHLTEGKIPHLELAKTGFNNMATHFVVEIQYWAEATFIFSKKIEKEENESEVKSQLNACGAKLKQLFQPVDIECDGSIMKTANSNTANIECYFTCNFQLPKDCTVPETFEEAIKFAKKLTQSFSQPMEGVPYRVYLHSLKTLPGITDNDQVPIIHQEVSDWLASRCDQLKKDYISLEEKANKLLSDRLVAEKLIPFRKKIEDFKTYLDYFRGELETELKKWFTGIRSGHKDEAALMRLLDRIVDDDEFTYNPSRLEKWLNDVVYMYIS